MWPTYTEMDIVHKQVVKEGLERGRWREDRRERRPIWTSLQALGQALVRTGSWVERRGERLTTWAMSRSV